MTCENAKWLLYRYADCSLLEDDMQTMTAHLAECSGCRDRLAGMREIEESIIDIEEETPSANLRESVLAAYRNRVPNRKLPTHRRESSWTSLRVAAMVLLGVGLSSGITASLLRSPPSTTNADRVSPAKPISLDAAFPLVTNDSYTILRADGVRVAGWKTRIIN